MTTKDEGHVQKYPCDCTDPGNLNAVCWIVRHPKLQPPISFETEAEAEEELDRLRKGLIMLTSKRITKKKQADGSFIEFSFRDLRKGDEFHMFEEDGEPVDNGRLFVALSDAHPPAPLSACSEPRPDDERPWGIQVDEIVDGKIV